MNKFEVLITDVTHMSGDRLCIAGWDMKEKKLVRPLLEGRRAWIASHKIVTGNIVNFTKIPGVPNSFFPHKTEDALVTAEYEVQDKYDDEQIHNILKDSLTDNPANYFQFEVDKQYTLSNTDCPSLGGVKILAKGVEFYKKNRPNKSPQLRGKFSADGGSYNFPVTSVLMREMDDKKGVVELNNLVRKYKSLHLRLGLARPWDTSGQEKKCYCQLNNVLFLERI